MVTFFNYGYTQFQYYFTPYSTEILGMSVTLGALIASSKRWLSLLGNIGGGFWTDKGEGVIICAPNPKAWATVAKAMDRPDFLDPNSKYATCNTRAAHQEEIIPEIEAWLSTFPNIDAAIEHMMKYDVPCCKINNTEDVVNDPQVKHMGYIVQAPTQNDIKQPTFLTRGRALYMNTSTPSVIGYGGNPAYHQPLGGARGQATDVEIQARWLLRTKDKMIRMMSEMTGQPEDKMRLDCERDYFMSAEEALQYGIIDQIYYPRKKTMSEVNDAQG